MKLRLLDKIKRYIKLVYACPKYKKLLKTINKSNGHRAILIGTPVHGNLGDHLITYESLKYLKKFNFTEIIEVPEIFYELFYKKIKFSVDDILFISGGGWMGSLYYDEIIIEDIIERWNQNNIIIFPQTVSFTSGKFTTPEKLSKIINSHSKLIITVRDEKSYDVCINLLKINQDKVLLLPDMALNGLKKIKDKDMESNSIIFSIRNDRERNTSINLKEIQENLKKEKLSFYNSSSVVNKKSIKILEREKWILDKINEFSHADIVITDRLHSMVFALLAGTKCIAIDNSTHKVKGVYKKWLYDIEGIWFVDDNTYLDLDFIKKVRKSNKKINSKVFDEMFLPLDEKIGEILL